MKSCTKPNCEQTNPQPFSSFAKNKKGRNGLYCHCKSCQRKVNRTRYMSPEGRLKQWKNNIKKYWPGSSAEEAFSKYTAILIKQKHVCAICSKPEMELDKKFNALKMMVVDHCHNTSRVRGLLCNKCNRGIGQLLDSAVLCTLAASYIIDAEMAGRQAEIELGKKLYGGDS